MKIKKTVERFPGGLMVIPLVMGVLVNTFFPNALKIGSFTTALFSNAGVNCVVALQVFCVGATLKFRDVPEAVKRGTVLLCARLLMGFALVMVIGRIFGLNGIWGISILAIVSCAVAANGSMYLSLMGAFGDGIDSAAQGIMAIHDGPFLSLILLGITGIAFVPFKDLLAVVIPIIIGFILGNLDPDIREFCRPGVKLMIPFSGFNIGAGINLRVVAKAGFSGIALAAIVFVFAALFCVASDKFINRRPGYAGAAVASIAGNTLVNPSAIATVLPKFKPYVASATTEIAAAVVILAFVCPLFTGFIAKKFGCPRFDNEAKVALAQGQTAVAGVVQQPGLAATKP